MKRVSIVGSATGRTFPKTGEVWTVNVQPPRRARYTRAFQLHPDAGRNAREDYWLRYCDVPIYTTMPIKESPNHRVYPIGAILPGPLCSSFDYMMALAILEGFDRIDLYGIALQFGTARERLMEHVSLAYWIGLARGRGIDVRIHGKGVMTFPYRYGFDYQRERTFGTRMAFWGALNMLSFVFDDGQAKTKPRGWKATVGYKKIEIGI